MSVWWLSCVLFVLSAPLGRKSKRFAPQRSNKIIFLKTNSLSYMHRGYFFMFCHYFYPVFYVVKHLRVIICLDRTLYKSWYIILQPSDNDNIEHKTQGEKQSRKPKRRATRKVCRYFEMNFIFVVRCKILISKGNGSLEV